MQTQAHESVAPRQPGIVGNDGALGGKWFGLVVIVGVKGG